MQLELELLAPARTRDIGIAAIDCGADAVYIAGPEFGARVAAGNSVEDIAGLCAYAKPFGVNVYAVVNTLLEKNEMKKAERLMKDLFEAGVSAFIIQDLSILSLDLPPVRLFASTQTVLRTPERAKQLERLGFSRLILERQLSLDEIRSIRKAVDCDLEFFVHGALCTGYSGQCYLSQAITGRSANRGCCAQACRSRYDLVDASGRTIEKDRSLLSLKDLRLDGHIDELVEAGISSFKIEGRLKNASYVKNVVLHYRRILDEFIENHPQYRRSSFGNSVGGFSPDPELTFHRGFTDAFITGRKGSWNSVDAAKYLGEAIGTVTAVSGNTLIIDGGKALHNGDGLAIVQSGAELTGMRAETVQGRSVTVKDASSIKVGAKVYRNLNTAFEREMEKNMPRRLIPASISYTTENGKTTLSATAEDGGSVSISFDETAPVAENKERASSLLENQLSKSAGIYTFSLRDVRQDCVYSYSASLLNGLRRQLAEMLHDEEMARMKEDVKPVSNLGASELNLSQHDIPDELMRTRYCIRHELGACLKQGGGKIKGPLFLINQGRKLKLEFDCNNCEMVVTL